MFEEDLFALFFDSGMPCLFKEIEYVVLLDMPDDMIFDGGQQSRDYTMTYQSINLPGLRSGNSVSIAGIDYKVREVSTIDDGALSRAKLTKI